MSADLCFVVFFSPSQEIVFSYKSLVRLAAATDELTKWTEPRRSRRSGAAGAGGSAAGQRPEKFTVSETFEGFGERVREVKSVKERRVSVFSNCYV